MQELETPQPKAVPQPLKQKECTQPEEEKKLLEELLKETETSLLHHQSTCPAVSCQKISAEDQKAQKSLKDKFKHEWLTDKSLAYCSKTGIWWLEYVEGKGMYCLLCRKHNTKNEQNKSKVLSSDPAVRYRKPTITSHADSRQHLAAIEAEHLQRVSTFHKESVNRENVADDVLYKALMSVYWIAKHEIPIHKLVPLLQLLEKVGVTEMKYFTHRSGGSVRELFLTLGQVILEQLLEKVHRSNFVGLLCDDVTDIATLEQFISFIQFVDPDSGEVRTDFLFVENALANSKSADAQTLFTILTSKLQELKLTTEKCSSFVSDGANVMLGARSGLATQLKELNPTLISVHCICHKLALACADTSKDLDYIAGVEHDLRTLWKAMENSPKGTNMYFAVQEELKSLRLQDQRLKKACHTRWLSMGQAGDTVYRDLEAVLRTLQSLEKEDTVACGLLTKMHKPKFIGCIYIFQHVLPILNQLSKTFQKGSVNFSHIGPAVEHAKQKLQTISSDALPVKQLQEDFKPAGRLSRIDLAPTEHHFVKMDRLLKKYVTSLITNIDNRFKASIPVLKAFSIFDVMAIPSIRSPGFKEYGNDHIKSLSKHFFAERETEENDHANVNAEKLKAEWGKFKFDLIDWKDELNK